MNDKALAAFYDFRPRPADAWMFKNRRYWLMIEAQIKAFPAMVLPSPDKPAAICGLGHNGFGYGQVWLVTGQDFERHVRVIARQLRSLCEVHYDLFELHRLDMLVDSSRVDAARFAELLGFRLESAGMKGMGIRGNDVDIYLFERGKE